MTRRTSVFGLTLWCLLSLWLFFGGLELAEQVHVVPETAVDEAALVQWASGLKSDVPGGGASSQASVAPAVAGPAFPLSSNTVHQLTRLVLHGSPSLPLHQHLSVYRI